MANKLRKEKEIDRKMEMEIHRDGCERRRIGEGCIQRDLELYTQFAALVEEMGG